MLLAVNFPSWLKPEIIPGLPLRWYGLMYIVAFAIAYLLFKKQVKERNFPMSEEDLSSLFVWGILGLILGARIFYGLFYEINYSNAFSVLHIFSPFRDGRFVGFQGMSYHGGVIGCILGIVFFTIRKKFDFREIGDMLAASIPLGYTFGRLGNFINGELYGRISTGPFAMIFPQGGIHPSNIHYQAIITEAERLGLNFIPGEIFYPPRHPSQLYEALFEGVILWLVILLLRKKNPFKGFLITLYISGYGLVRFFIEYFREPDSALGYRLEFVRNDLPPALSHPMFSFSQGQILCFAMIVLGIIWAFIAYKQPNREAVYIYPEKNEVKDKDEKAAERKRRRKLRKQLR